MCSKLKLLGLFVLMLAFQQQALAQCFASPGNPVAGAENMGVMNKNFLRVMVFYRYHSAEKYYTGSKPYSGPMQTLENAWFNYSGALLAYGLTERLSLETEAGYFLNKTQRYKGGYELTGNGPSNLIGGLKYALYQNTEKRVEWTVGTAAKIPLNKEFVSVNGVELPVDLQPSTASYGIVLQSFLIKENSFDAWRVFMTQRYEHNFVNPHTFLFGSTFNTSAFFSKHYIFGDGRFKDWTFILQARFQMQQQNRRNNTAVEASGSRLLFLSPQINCSINEIWNLSASWEQIVYRHYHSVQLGGKYSLMLHLSRDIELKKPK
jgi:hypothetical protein